MPPSHTLLSYHPHPCTDQREAAGGEGESFVWLLPCRVTANWWSSSTEGHSPDPALSTWPFKQRVVMAPLSPALRLSTVPWDSPPPCPHLYKQTQSQWGVPPASCGGSDGADVFRYRLTTRQRDTWLLAKLLCRDPAVGRWTNLIFPPPGWPGRPGLQEGMEHVHPGCAPPEKF